MTVLAGLKAFSRLTIYTLGSFDRISVIFNGDISAKGSVVGMTDFRVEEKGLNSCIVYGFQRLARIFF